MFRAHKNFPELKEIDSLLRCGICYDYMKNTLSTSCSHNYCSYCIRKFMQYKCQCPTCFKEATEPQLRNNRLVDQLIVLFEKLCEKIEDFEFNRFQAHANVGFKDGDELQAGGVTPQTRNEITDFENEATGNHSTKSKILVPDMFTPRRKVKKPAPAVTEPVKLVPCPVCDVNIPERNINAHLDNCLAKSKKEAQEAASVPVDRRKPLPKLVYPLLQEKDLKRKLKELGLSTLGDRKTLINRHQRFNVLYNSECDSLNPRPVSEIVDQLTSEEKLEKKVAPTAGNNFASAATWLSVDKKTDSKTIEMAQRQYLNENKSSYAALVEGIKKHQKTTEPKSEDGASTSALKSSELEEQQSSKSVKVRRDSSSEGRSLSPEICVIPVEQGRNNTLQSSFDLFEMSKVSPAKLSGQYPSSGNNGNISSPSDPGSSRSFPFPTTPEHHSTNSALLSFSGRATNKTCTSGPSYQRTIFPSTPPKFGDFHGILPECSTAVVKSPSRASSSADHSPPTTPQHKAISSLPLVAQFSPNLGATFQPSDHERTPSPIAPVNMFTPGLVSPPVHRSKRPRTCKKLSPFNPETEGGDVPKVRMIFNDQPSSPSRFDDSRKQMRNLRKRVKKKDMD